MIDVIARHAERGTGQQPLPPVCAPTAHAMQHQECSCCGRAHWRTDEDGRQRQHSLVFTRAAQLTTTFISVACATDGCRGLLQVWHEVRSTRCSTSTSGFCHDRGLLLLRCPVHVNCSLHARRLTAASMDCCGRRRDWPLAFACCTSGCR